MVSLLCSPRQIQALKPQGKQNTDPPPQYCTGLVAPHGGHLPSNGRTLSKYLYSSDCGPLGSSQPSQQSHEADPTTPIVQTRNLRPERRGRATVPQLEVAVPGAVTRALL